MKDKTRARVFGFPLNDMETQQMRTALSKDEPRGERGHVCWQIQNLITASFEWNIHPIKRLATLFPEYTWKYWNLYNSDPTKTKEDFLKLITSSDFLWPVNPYDLSIYEWVTASDWNQNKHLQILASPDLWDDLEWEEENYGDHDDEDNNDDNFNTNWVPAGPPSQESINVSEEEHPKAFDNFCEFFGMKGPDMEKIFKALKKPY